MTNTNQLYGEKGKQCQSHLLHYKECTVPVSTQILNVHIYQINPNLDIISTCITPDNLHVIESQETVKDNAQQNENIYWQGQIFQKNKSVLRLSTHGLKNKQTSHPLKKKSLEVFYWTSREHILADNSILTLQSQVQQINIFINNKAFYK